MKRFCFTFSLFLLLAGLPGLASAQIVSQPGLDESPLGPNVSGYMMVGLGLSYIPLFDAEADSVTEGFAYQTRQEVAGFPGFGASMGFIPAFGMNGVDIEATYEIHSFRWKQNVNDDEGSFRGESELAYSALSFSVNYVRFFLHGSQHLYLLAGGGYMWSTTKLSAETDGDGKISSSSFPNWRVNTGFGYLHQIQGGAIGGEIRADLPMLQTKLNHDDSRGSFDLDLEHPVFLRVCLTFSLGQLRD